MHATKGNFKNRSSFIFAEQLGLPTFSSSSKSRAAYLNGPRNSTALHYAIWFLVFFVTTEGYGLRMESWGGVGGVFVGWFGVLQILLALVALVMLPKGLNDIIRGLRNPIGTPLLILAVAMPIYLFLLTILNSSFFDGDINFSKIINNILMVKPVLLLFLFANLTSRPEGLKMASDMLALNALVAALVIIAIIALQIETAVVSVLLSEDLSRSFRAIFPASLLVAAGWLLFWSRYLNRGGGFMILASMICLIATVMQMHRSTLFAVIVVFVFLLARLYFVRLGIHSFRKWLLIVLVCAILFAPTYYIIAISPTALLIATSAFDELFSLSGNSGHRALLVANSFAFIMARLGFGVGFDWERIEDFGYYLHTSFVAGPTLDSTYANIIIVYGIPGIILFLWLASEIFKAGTLKQSKLLRPLDKEITFFIRPFLIYCLFLGLGTDIVLISPSSAIFALFLLIVNRLQKHQSKQTLSGPPGEIQDSLSKKIKQLHR